MLLKVGPFKTFRRKTLYISPSYKLVLHQMYHNKVMNNMDICRMAKTIIRCGIINILNFNSIGSNRNCRSKLHILHLHQSTAIRVQVCGKQRRGDRRVPRVYFRRLLRPLRAISKDSKTPRNRRGSSSVKIMKVVIRVRFPDNHTLEATFHPSETTQSLISLLNKVIA